MLNPPPALVTITVYWPLESRCGRGAGVSVRVIRRLTARSGSTGTSAATTSSGRRISGASSGTRSCSSSSSGPHRRLGADPPAMNVRPQAVGDRAQAHALVVGHVRPDDLAPLVAVEPVRSEVEGLVEPVRALAAERPQGGEVGDRGPGVHHHRQQRGVRGDDEVLAPARASTLARARRTTGTGSRGLGSST